MSGRVFKKSTILLTVIIILLFLGVLGMTLMQFLYLRTTKSNLSVDRVKAFYLAEAGVAKAINELRNNKDDDHNGLGNVSVSKLSGGTFWAKHDLGTETITSTGEFNQIKRTLQIKYTIF